MGGKPYVLMPRSLYEELVQKLEAPGNPALGTEPLGLAIKMRRRLARLTVAEVSRRADIAPETLSRIENGHRNPTVGTVRAILRAIVEAGERPQGRVPGRGTS